MRSMGSPNFVAIDDDPDVVETPDFTVLDTLPGEVVAEVVARRKKPTRNDANDLRAGREIKVADPADARDYIPDDEVALTDDLAATVVRKTMKRIAAGKVEPTLREGLQAQQILDRRAEKAADRRFMLALSQALAGGGAPAPAQLLPGEDEGVIEGSFEDVDLAPAHLRSET